MSQLDGPVAGLAEAVRSGRLRALDLVEESLLRIAASDLHAVLEINPRAKEQAKAVKGGRLAGVPFLAKDNFLTTGTHTTASSNILKSFRAPFQATVIEKLEAEGAVMVGKANLDAFAHGSSTENSDFGPTHNPHNLERVPGGSSGGSAAAVAAGLVPFALGTDTGGSIRQPAALCGVVGLKPTYGLVSRFGVIAMASSTDVIGPLTKTVADTAEVLEVIAGQDPRDATTIQRNEDGYAGIRQRIGGVKVGVIKEYMGEGLDSKVRANITDAIEKLEQAGAYVKEVSIPALKQALACYYILVPAEVSSNLARYDGIKYGYSDDQATTLNETYMLSRDHGLGLEAKRRILIGTYVLSSGYYDAYYRQAQKVRTLLIQEFDNAYKDFDLLVGPTSPATAFRLGEKTHDPLSMYLTDIMTVAVNLTGACAISLPSGMVDGLPVGLQLIGPQRGERQLLAAAMSAENLLGAKA
jgi:aspartyl-tRNA(Asn)/glutamyl-tRNA(Gln) amidotransferase subunit A